MRLLGRFKKNELEIITEDKQYLSVRSYLEKELMEVREGKATYHTIEDLEKDLDEIIQKNIEKAP